MNLTQLIVDFLKNPNDNIEKLEQVCNEMLNSPETGVSHIDYDVDVYMNIMEAYFAKRIDTTELSVNEGKKFDALISKLDRTYNWSGVGGNIPLIQALTSISGLLTHPWGKEAHALKQEGHSKEAISFYSAAREHLTSVTAVDIRRYMQDMPDKAVMGQTLDILDQFNEKVDSLQDLQANKTYVKRQAITQYKHSVSGDVIKSQLGFMDPKEFKTSLKGATSQCSKVLNNDHRSSSILKSVVNFFTHLSVVGLIGNAVNKAYTGKWLLFDKTNEAKQVNNISKSIMPQ